jgi:hypothetical protein
VQIVIDLEVCVAKMASSSSAINPHGMLKEKNTSRSSHLVHEATTFTSDLVTNQLLFFQNKSAVQINGRFAK